MPIRNFSAGPAVLPLSVYEQAREAISELRAEGHARGAKGVGMSILEVSHRGKPYAAVHEAATELCHQVLAIPKTHRVLLLQGGASLQFTMVPQNLAQADKTACYVDTGVWAAKAIAESKIIGPTEVIASSAATRHDRIPELPDPSRYAAASYLHITTNNTIFGTEYPEIPNVGEVPLVVDCSSHIGSRPLAFDRVGLGYAGAQKNLGPSGVTLVFIREDLLSRVPKAPVPVFLQYKTHADADGIYHTPNTFGTLVLKLVLEWMREQGGLVGLEAHNRRKAQKLYDLFDESSLYRGHAQVASRSLMNVTWTFAGATKEETDALTTRFFHEATAAGFEGLEGHRSVGGCRASIYNACPEAAIDDLCTFMREFERRA